MIALSTNLPSHIWDKIRKRENGCWEWRGYITPSGYGITSIASKTKRAHRVVYMLLAGPITTPTLDHLCRNRKCVRPGHLREATHRENTFAPGSRSVTKRNGGKTYCLRGHKFTPENTYRTTAGGRGCLACSRGQARRRYYASKGVAALAPFA